MIDYVKKTEIEEPVGSPFERFPELEAEEESEEGAHQDEEDIRNLPQFQRSDMEDGIAFRKTKKRIKDGDDLYENEINNRTEIEIKEDRAREAREEAEREAEENQKSPERIHHRFFNEPRENGGFKELADTLDKDAKLALFSDIEYEIHKADEKGFSDWRIYEKVVKNI